jgi:predicted DNA binding CopG/RHH family protein
MKKSKALQVRLTEEEREVLESKAKEHGLNISQFIRAILSKVKSVKLNAEVELK